MAGPTKDPKDMPVFKNTIGEHIANVNASNAIEGIEPDEWTKDVQKKLVSGELTLDQAIGMLNREYAVGQKPGADGGSSPKK